MSASDLILVGASSPIAATAIRDAFGTAASRLPDAYVELLATSGAGELCGFIELPDPTAVGGRHAVLTAALREHGPAARNRGLWLELSANELAQVALLGIDRLGAPLVAVTAEDLRFLGADGKVTSVGTFDQLVATQRERSDLELDVPMIYATNARPSDEVVAALARGDQAGADAALGTLDGREVLPFAWIALIDRLLGPEGSAIETDLRSEVIVELYSLANRRMPALGQRLGLRELRRALGADAIGELRDRFRTAFLPRSTIFDGGASAAPTGDDLPGAADRGLVAPAGFVVDTDARLQELAAAWQAQDPSVALEPALQHIAQLHPTQRTGYTGLLAQLRAVERTDPALHGLADPKGHLAREADAAWAHLVLALRSRDGYEAQAALEVLHGARTTQALPFIRSLVDSPPPDMVPHWNAELVYVDVAQLDDQAIKEVFLPCLAPKQKATPRRKTAAYEALERFADDDRVFEAYLANFAAALPYSVRAIDLADRWSDPRVIPALREQLKAEGRYTLSGSRRVENLTVAYETVATHLARLGDDEGKTALAKYARLRKRSDGNF